MSKLYFAYGSNLNKSQMALRSPTAKALGSAYFPNWRLVFRGVADIEEGDEQALLPVGIWSIEEPDEAALDRYEGVSSGLYRKVEINGMLTYRMNSSGTYSPSSYRDFSLDTSELYNARDNAHFEDRGGWGYASWM